MELSKQNGPEHSFLHTEAQEALNDATAGC